MDPLEHINVKETRTAQMLLDAATTPVHIVIGIDNMTAVRAMTMFM
jgi:hypothetical protein